MTYKSCSRYSHNCKSIPWKLKSRKTFLSWRKAFLIGCQKFKVSVSRTPEWMEGDLETWGQPAWTQRIATEDGPSQAKYVLLTEYSLYKDPITFLQSELWHMMRYSLSVFVHGNRMKGGWWRPSVLAVLAWPPQLAAWLGLMYKTYKLRNSNKLLVN